MKNWESGRKGEEGKARVRGGFGENLHKFDSTKLMARAALAWWLISTSGRTCNLKSEAFTNTLVTACVHVSAHLACGWGEDC